MALFKNAILALVVFLVVSLSILNQPLSPLAPLSLLSDPFLQLPTETSVNVVWFTEFLGSEHRVIYGDNLETVAIAKTTQLSRMREDINSQVSPAYEKTTERNIWRHEAAVTGLTPGQRIPYQVISIEQEREIKSDIFSLTPKPLSGTALKILLTSDHQLMPMVAANLQKVVETVGRVDAVFIAGDLVNIPDRASEWFDDSRGGAFFPCLQGQANYQLEKNKKHTIYHGGELIQYAPLYPAIGNHEVMGRFSQDKELDQQFSNAFPRSQAEKYYLEVAQKNAFISKEEWIKNNSFNTDSYEEIFTLPNKKYYAVTFGDIRLVVLYITQIWRSPNLDPQVKGRYQEAQKDLNDPQNWGYGQHIFEPITPDSSQYQWLETELQSQKFKQAKYKIIMFHHPVHTLGGNIVPPYTDPIANIDNAEDGSIQSVRYKYPKEDDYIIRDLMPLLESAGVQLVFFGHSHLWNRFVSVSGIHFLETSNVGNSYGAHLEENERPIPPDYSPENYSVTGDPNGLEPVIPSLIALADENHYPLPYIASNDITVFSIFDTGKGTISSYRFDTRYPDSAAIKFDEFTIKH